jgi:hypothetical protein
MRRRQLAAAVALAALLLAPAAEALTPAQVVSLLKSPVPPPTLALNFQTTSQSFAERGVNYASFSALPGASFSRSSAGYANNATSTNFVPNSTMQGAQTVAQVGGNGTQPTGWLATTNGDGLTWQVVGLSQQGGFQCVDERLYGTTTSTGAPQVYFSSGIAIPAATGQVFTGSVYSSLVGGTTNNLSGVSLATAEANSNGNYISGSQYNVALSATSTLTRTTNTHTVGNAAAAGLPFFLSPAVAGTGLPVDATFRICAPMVNHGPTAATYVPTSGSAVTVNDPNGYDLSLVYFPTRTNSIRNGNATGATVGTLGSGGAMPTTWPSPGTNGAGLSVQIVAVTPTANGNMVDVRYFGTNTGTAAALYSYFESSNQIVAATGQTWTESLSAALVGGTLPSGGICLVQQEGGGTGTYIRENDSAALALTSALTRFSWTATLSNASTLRVLPALRTCSNIANGQSYDFTLRYYEVQEELQGIPAPAGGYPTAYIATAGSAVSVNDPRITDLGLLVEQASTNLTLQSNALGTSPWASGGTGGTTATNNAAAAPDGTTTATHILDTTTNGTHIRSQPVTIANGVVTASEYLKAGEYSLLQLDMSDLTSGDAYTVVNLSTCTLNATTSNGSWSGTSAKAVPVNNGWCWVALTSTKGAGTQVALNNYLNNGTTTSFAGTGSSGVYAWCSQIEALAFATSCTPTTSASATRAADVASVGGLKPGAGVTLWAKVNTSRAVAGPMNEYAVSLSDGTLNNRLSLFRQNTGANFAVRYVANGTVYLSAGGGNSWGIGTHKVIGSGPATPSGMLDGTTGYQGSAAPTVPRFTQLSIGVGESLGDSWLNDYVQAITVYQQAKSPAQEQALTH